MTKFMVECLHEAPAVCAKVLKEKGGDITKLTDLYLAKPYQKIVIVGSGSSYNIAQCARYTLEKYMDRKVEIITPIAFAKYDYKFHDNALIICISQSGRSTNTIAAIERAKQCGYDVTAISMVPNSPLTNYCEHVFVYGSYTGEADSFVCRGFSASVVFFAQFALEAGLKSGTCTKENYKKGCNDLQTIISFMPNAQEIVQKFYNQNKKDLYSMKRGMCIGIGSGNGILNEACLKFSETTGIPTNGYELEEFLHGPAFEVKKDHGLFILDMDDETHDRTLSIYEASKQLTDKVYLITRYPGVGDENTMYFPIHAEACLLPIVFVTPIQMIPGLICEDLGIRAITIYNYRASNIAITKTDI